MVPLTLPAVAPHAAGAVLQVATPGPDFDNDGVAESVDRFGAALS